MRWTIVVFVAASLMPSQRSQASVVTFANDYPGFVNAAGALSVIDFETLPDGTPSHVGAPITETFNYDAQGAHFSAPLGIPYIILGPTNFYLAVEAPSPPPGQHTWLIADLTEPAYAVGTFFAGTAEVCAFDEGGELLGCVSYSQAGEGNFVGIVSTTPIAQITQDGGSATTESMESFVFSPVAEPATAVLLAWAMLVSRVRRRGSRQR